MPPADVSGESSASARRRRVRPADVVSALRARSGDLHWPRTPALLGVVAGLWAAGIGLAIALLPMLILWMSSPESGLTGGGALHGGGLLWLVANGAPLTVSGLVYSLLPWGLALIPLALLVSSGRWAVRRSGAEDPRDVLQVVLSGAAAYVVVAVAVSLIASLGAASVGLGRAALGAALLSFVGLGVGAVRQARLLPDAWRGTPYAVAARAGVAGTCVIVGLGALAATISLLVHFDDAVTMAQSLHAGALGGLGLLVLGVAYVPVLSVWGAAYLVGAGIVVAPGVTVSPFIAAGTPTQLPPFPLLAALPQGAGPAAWLLPVAGIVSGVVAGLLIARTARDESRLHRLAIASGAAVVTGLLMAVLAALGSGALGDLRLAQVGPLPATVGVLAAVLVALGAVPSAIAPASPGRPSLRVALSNAPGDEDVAPEPDLPDPSS
jgi:hypothetical protein